MKIILFMAIGILIGLIFSYPEIKKIVFVYQTPICHVGTLPSAGQAQVTGKADTKNTKSLLKPTNCCLWHIVVEEDQERYRRNVRIFEKMSTEPFELVDGINRVQVFPANAQLMLHDDLNKKSRFLTPFPPRIDEALRALGIPTTDGLGFQRVLRVHEQIIQSGDDLFVFGEVILENGMKVIRGGKKLPFIISDYKDYDVIASLFKQVVGKIITATIVIVIFLLSVKPI